MKIKGLIYDLDGTIIDSEQIHEAGWIAAGKKFKVRITKKMLLLQKGRPDNEVTSLFLPKDKLLLSAKFVKAKEEYVIKNLSTVSLLPGFKQAVSTLEKKGVPLWICTSSKKFFIQAVLKKVPALSSFKNKIVYRELYKRGKPFPEPLLLTSKKMRLLPEECYYIGDAKADFKAAQNAKMNFIFFNSCNARKSPSPLSMKNHQEIMTYLK
jgi:HAD superfamily hydrolase (TIGR01509 family)